jgi:hypothetical protein
MAMRVSPLKQPPPSGGHGVKQVTSVGKLQQKVEPESQIDPAWQSLQDVLHS